MTLTTAFLLGLALGILLGAGIYRLGLAKRKAAERRGGLSEKPIFEFQASAIEALTNHYGAEPTGGANFKHVEYGYKFERDGDRIQVGRV